MILQFIFEMISCCSGVHFTSFVRKVLVFILSVPNFHLKNEFCTFYVCL